MGVAVIYALSRARPAGLLRLRAIDLLWGIGVGLGLRALQGWLAGVNLSAFPTIATLDGSSGIAWMFTVAVPAVFVAPVLEEFFFRAVVLVGVYQLFRRAVGIGAAATTAVLTSAGAFVLLHAVGGVLALQDGIQLFVVGCACAVLVIVTGRIWGAVLAHVVYNATYIALLVVGSALS